MARSTKAASPSQRTQNVVTSARLADRAQQMWSLLGVVASDLDATLTPAARDNIKRFLLHLAWHEGARLTRRTQLNGGPARSFFQFEMARAKDAGDYAIRKEWLGNLAKVGNRTQAEIRAAIAGLSAGSAFPPDNLVHTLLKTNDLFACYYARIALKRVPAAIPAGNLQHGRYWYQHWKVIGGDPEPLTQVFMKSADAVDRLLFGE